MSIFLSAGNLYEICKQFKSYKTSNRLYLTVLPVFQCISSKASHSHFRPRDYDVCV